MGIKKGKRKEQDLDALNLGFSRSLVCGPYRFKTMLIIGNKY